MAKQKVVWTIENERRLLAAYIAAGANASLREAAKYFGSTYDSVEGHMRPIKKLAEKMKNELKDNSEGDAHDIPRSKTASSTTKPTKKGLELNKVQEGRVTKTAKKGKATSIVKREPVDEDEEADDEIMVAGHSLMRTSGADQSRVDEDDDMDEV